MASITVRVPDSLAKRLAQSGNMSEDVRQALNLYYTNEKLQGDCNTDEDICLTPQQQLDLARLKEAPLEWEIMQRILERGDK